MISDPYIVVCIKTKQYEKAFLESGLESTELFNKSLGIEYWNIYYLTSERMPYIIKGGIPCGHNIEFVVKDERLFEYSKMKYEFYND
jgi:hypothetical protein